MRIGYALAGGLLIGCCVLAGCTAGGSAASTSAGVANGAAPAPNRAATGGGAGGSAQSGGTANQAVNPLPPAGREVIRSASISLSVPDVTRAADRVRQITDAAGGYSQTENDQADQADFTLQVPANALDAVVDQLAKLGHVTDRTAQSQDVTDQLVDVRSRVTSQQASVDRVRALLDRATSLSDVVSIEGELATRESNLEALEQRQAELSGQVAMSSVTVHIGRSAAPPVTRAAATGRGGFVGGLAAGWHSFVAVLGALAAAFGAVLPYLLGLGVPAALVWWFVRRRRTRRPAVLTRGESPTA